MWIESISYIVAFVVSAGMAVIGILFRTKTIKSLKSLHYRPCCTTKYFCSRFYLRNLGNTALRLIIGDLNLNATLSAKLAVFIPIIGIPFMLVSWFMLLKFAFNLNGYKFSKAFLFAYFPTFVVVVIILASLIHKEILLIPADPDLFVVRILVVLNLIVHVFFMLPFIKPKRNAPLLKEIGFDKKWAFLFLLCVLAYSAIMSFFNFYGFISTCISIIVLFGSGVFIPIRIRLNSTTQETTNNMDFKAFCKSYEISKREAEIVLEICSGKPNKAISEKLYITLQTVKDHNHRIFTKTGIKSRVQLANLVREKLGDIPII